MLQVFAANRSTQQTAPSTRASCTAKCATAASSVLRATVLVAELAVCPWTKASTFKRRASECICRPRNIPLSPSSFPPYSRVAYPNRGLELRKVSSQFLSSPSSLREYFTWAKLKHRPTIVERPWSVSMILFLVNRVSINSRKKPLLMQTEPGSRRARITCTACPTYPLNHVHPVTFPPCPPCRSTTKTRCRPSRDSRFSTSPN